MHVPNRPVAPYVSILFWLQVTLQEQNSRVVEVRPELHRKVRLCLLVPPLTNPHHGADDAAGKRQTPVGKLLHHGRVFQSLDGLMEVPKVLQGDVLREQHIGRIEAVARQLSSNILSVLATPVSI